MTLIDIVKGVFSCGKVFEKSLLCFYYACGNIELSKKNISKVEKVVKD